MYYIEYNTASEKRSKAWEISNKDGLMEQEFVTTKIYYRPKLPNGVYSSDGFGVANKNGFYIELLSPNWHLQKPFYWRLEPDFGSGYERIILYLDRTVEVISAAGFSSYSDLVAQEFISYQIEPATPQRGLRISNTKLQELKSKPFYQRQKDLEPFFSEHIDFTGDSDNTRLLDDESDVDFHTPGLLSEDQIDQINVRIHVVRLQTLRRMPVGGGAGIGSAISESELLWEGDLAESSMGVVSKKRIVVHHFEDGSAEIVCSKSILDPDSYSEFRSAAAAARQTSNFEHKCIATFRIIAPDRFNKSGYFIEPLLNNTSDPSLYIYLSENSRFDINLHKDIMGVFDVILANLGINVLTRQDLWDTFNVEYPKFKARKWINLSSLPRAKNDITQEVRDGTTEPWTWPSSVVLYEPVDIGTQLLTDLLIGFIPIVGDTLDIVELFGAVFTGKDRWGESVNRPDFIGE